MKKISIIVPIYYGEKYIPDIICQIEECKIYLKSRDYIEVILVNDAPDAPISENWQSKLVKIIIINSEYNEGIHGARVKGLMQSHGDYVLFFDQDDRIKPDFFYTQLQSIGDADAVICRAINAGKEVTFSDEILKNMTLKKYDFSAWNPIVSPGQVLIRRQSISDIWIKNIMQNNGADDWLLWLCMMAEGCKFELNKNVLYEHVMQESNTSNDIISMLKSEQELMSIIQKTGMFSNDDFHSLMEGFFLVNQRRTEVLYNKKKKLDVIDKWIKLKRDGIKYSDYLHAQNIQTVAIYGCGILGEYLYGELKDIVDVRYFIDRNAKKIQKEIPVFTLQDTLSHVDGIIITLVEGIETVKKEIEEIIYNKIFVLKEWLEDAENT